jgi:hypothetical protein
MSDLQTLFAVGIGVWASLLGLAAYLEHKGW